jgi:hypothetical protein
MSTTGDIEKLQSRLPELMEKYSEALAQMQARRREFEMAAQQGSAVVMSALNRELQAYSKLGEGVRGVYQQALRELASYLAKEAELKAAEQVAMALSDFASFNFVGGAEHMAAAVAWEALGAGVSAGGGAVAGAGHTRSRESYAGDGRSGYYSSGGRAGAASETGVPGAALAPGAGSNAPTGGLTVAIMGNEEAGQWLATTLNRAVTQQGVQLVSSASQRGAPVGH